MTAGRLVPRRPLPREAPALPCVHVWRHREAVLAVG